MDFFFVAKKVEFDGDNALAAVDKGGQVRFSGELTWVFPKIGVPPNHPF